MWFCLRVKSGCMYQDLELYTVLPHLSNPEQGHIDEYAVKRSQMCGKEYGKECLLASFNNPFATRKVVKMLVWALCSFQDYKMWKHQLSWTEKICLLWGKEKVWRPWIVLYLHACPIFGSQLVFIKQHWWPWAQGTVTWSNRPKAKYSSTMDTDQPFDAAHEPARWILGIWSFSVSLFVWGEVERSLTGKNPRILRMEWLFRQGVCASSKQLNLLVLETYIYSLCTCFEISVSLCVCDFDSDPIDY